MAGNAGVRSLGRAPSAGHRGCSPGGGRGAARRDPPQAAQGPGCLITIRRPAPARGRPAAAAKTHEACRGRRRRPHRFPDHGPLSFLNAAVQDQIAQARPLTQPPEIGAMCRSYDGCQRSATMAEAAWASRALTRNPPAARATSRESPGTRPCPRVAPPPGDRAATSSKRTSHADIADVAYRGTDVPIGRAPARTARRVSRAQAI